MSKIAQDTSGSSFFLPSLTYGVSMIHVDRDLPDTQEWTMKPRLATLFA